MSELEENFLNLFPSLTFEKPSEAVIWYLQHGHKFMLAAKSVAVSRIKACERRKHEEMFSKNHFLI